MSDAVGILLSLGLGTLLGIFCLTGMVMAHTLASRHYEQSIARQKETIQHERERCERLDRRIEDLEKLISAKDLSGYLAIKDSAPMKSLGRSDYEEAELVRQRLNGMRQAMDAGIRFEMGDKLGE